LLVNGRAYAVRAVVAETAEAIDLAKDAGATAVVLEEPAESMLRYASESGLAVVVRPLRIEDDLSRTMAMHGGTTSDLQAALRDRLALYTHFGGVWLWDLGVRGRAMESLAEAILGPVFDHCAPLSRPRAERVKGYAP